MPKTKCVNCGRICWNCRKCHNRTYCEFCNTCNLHGQDEPTFFTKRGWSDTFDAKVRAKGMAGAVWQGVRQARRESLKPRTHVRQVRVMAMTA